MRLDLASRDLDWRFLTANPELGRTLRLDAGRADVGSAPAFDTVIADSADARAVELASKALVPGGAFFAREASPGDRPLLARAGFEAVTPLVRWPAVSNTQFWIPAKPRAATWYALRPPTGTGFARAVRHRARWARAALRLQLARRRPGPLLAFRSEPGSSAPPRPAGIRGAIRDDLLPLLVTGGSSPLNKVVVLFFPPGSPEPDVAVKFARVPDAVPGLEREAHALERLEALRIGAVAGAPRISHYDETGPVLVETVRDGTPMTLRLRRSSFRELALLGARQLALLRLDGAGDAAGQRDLVDGVVGEFTAAYRGVVAADDLTRCANVLARLPVLPPVVEHRDFSPWNVMVRRDGTLGVLDWESSEPAGLPVVDLTYFLTHLALDLEGAVPRDDIEGAYRRLLDPATLTGGAFRAAAELYRQAVAVPADAEHGLRLLCWMIHSRSERRTPSEPAELLRGRFVRLWAAELESGRA